MLIRRNKRERVARFELIPMIDVMMILTIFLAVMAFMPQVHTSIQAQLPKSTAGDDTPPSVTIEVTRKGIAYAERLMGPDALGAEVRQAIKKDPETAFVIAADKTLPYDTVMQVLDRVKANGAKRIALATQQD